LSKHNNAVIQAIIEMFEMNHNLISLNLDYCGIFRQALTLLISNLSVSETIQCLHLSGNMEITPQFE